ncbi:hypothetical protein BDQ17DRAFT_1421917 [Cyathus striatus]|nr:hypothetical protein BDQ17DRAFT_1421917 [Cyathus striatus]
MQQTDGKVLFVQPLGIKGIAFDMMQSQAVVEEAMLLVDVLKEDVSEWENEDFQGVPGEDSNADLVELTPQEILGSLQCECQFHAELEILSTPTPYKKILANKPASFWKTAEAHHGLGYNGLSDRTKHHHNKKQCDKEEKDAVTRESNTAQKFHSFFTVQPDPQLSVNTEEEINDSFCGYISDLSDDEDEFESIELADENETNELLDCELNFIEFFWGAVKKYLQGNCDYTFTTLQENMPKALASVSVETIRKWEHHVHHWIAVSILLHWPWPVAFTYSESLVFK